MGIARPGRQATLQACPEAQRRTAKGGFLASRGMAEGQGRKADRAALRRRPAWSRSTPRGCRGRPGAGVTPQTQGPSRRRGHPARNPILTSFNLSGASGRIAEGSSHGRKPHPHRFGPPLAAPRPTKSSMTNPIHIPIDRPCSTHSFDTITSPHVDGTTGPQVSVHREQVDPCARQERFAGPPAACCHAQRRRGHNWAGLVIPELDPKVRRVHPKRSCHEGQGLGARVPFAAFDQAHIVPVQVGSLSQLFLTQPASTPAGPNAFSQGYKVGIALHVSWSRAEIGGSTH